jgi:hypothetical protein
MTMVLQDQNQNDAQAQAQAQAQSQTQPPHYTRKYPLYSTPRIRNSLLERIKTHGKYGMSISEILTKIIDGYEAEQEKRAELWDHAARVKKELRK